MTKVVSILNKSEIDEKIRLERVQRYAIQSVARMALPTERVGICLRHKLSENVTVWKHKDTKRAFYNGLMVCGSVWGCPVCAAKISEKRRSELKLAFTQWKNEGHKIAMLTLTFSHKKKDKLGDTLKRFSSATTKFMTGKAYHNIRIDMGIEGRVRAFEVTYGQNGWHPHLHIALFYKNDVELKKIKIRMYELWEKACNKFGLTSNKKYGLDLQSAESAESYFSKHGTWSLEQELTKAHIKVAKHDSLTPFDFLRRFLVTGEFDDLEMFKEYFLAFKGKRQLQWSQGFKQRFNLDDKTDEELAAEKVEDADMLGMLSAEEWSYILKNELRAKLLNNVEIFGYWKGVEVTLKKASSCPEDAQEILI